MHKTLIVITGPTGVGKTDLCIRIAQHYGIPIINADSRQIYSGMSIGTAAPTAEQLKEVRHFFVNTLPLEAYYSAAMYEADVNQLLDRLLFGRTSVPIAAAGPIGEEDSHEVALLTGGSMMYIDAVCHGIDDIPTITDDTRTWMKGRLETEGLDALCEELRVMDPEYYSIVDRRNTRRVIHGLEICHQTGKTYTSFRVRQHKERPYRIIKIGLNRDRSELYERINSRVDLMMHQGFLDEALRLYPMRELNALNTVGYKELFAHIEGKWSLEEATERIKGNTRRYARKQLTWYKRDPDVIWKNADQEDDIIRFIEEKVKQDI